MQPYMTTSKTLNDFYHGARLLCLAPYTNAMLEWEKVNSSTMSWPLHKFCNMGRMAAGHPFPKSPYTEAEMFYAYACMLDCMHAVAMATMDDTPFVDDMGVGHGYDKHLDKLHRAMKSPTAADDLGAELSRCIFGHATATTYYGHVIGSPIDFPGKFKDTFRQFNAMFCLAGHLAICNIRR